MPVTFISLTILQVQKLRISPSKINQIHSIFFSRGSHKYLQHSSVSEAPSSHRAKNPNILHTDFCCPITNIAQLPGSDAFLCIDGTTH